MYLLKHGETRLLSHYVDVVSFLYGFHITRNSVTLLNYTITLGSSENYSNVNM